MHKIRREDVKHREVWTVPEVTQHILQHLHCSTQLSPTARRTVILFCAHRCATDHNVDNTTGMLQEWLAAVGSDYAAVVWKPEEEARWLTEGKGADGEQPSPRAQLPKHAMSIPCREGEAPLSRERLTFPYLRSYPDEQGPKHWTKERHQFLMELRQEALAFARDWGADYILVRNRWEPLVPVPNKVWL